MITTVLVALLVLANLVVSNTTSSDDADASAAETATTSNAPPVDASIASSEPANDLIAAALDPDVDIDSWLPESLPEFMCDYVGLLREKELEEDKARWKREDYIFSRLRKLLLEGDHGHQNSSQGTLKDKEGSGTGHVLPLVK
ncbi:hypothetical protein TorRG33x02_285420 [Trema orientale]|uniref:Transmembrane protein n=1 Tax=Trema orientale TaxID=63057 RepID=A0A2P5CGQ9_TREOI|nr:hypothetical protein TorRG33x02_285420 [Trema orientale]